MSDSARRPATVARRDDRQYPANAFVSNCFPESTLQRYSVVQCIGDAETDITLILKIRTPL